MVRTTAQAAVTALGATKTYGSGETAVRALDSISLEVPPASWTAVMGPSGSGKSSLLHCLAGLERVDRGRVLLAGRDITSCSDRELTRLRRGEIGFAFQNFNLVTSLTAAQNVALPLRLAGLRPTRQDIHAALDEVGLADRARHRPGQLSGGQQQRVALARAIVARPTVLFADEPTGALDTASARSVFALLRAMVERGQTVVMVTHDPVAAANADSALFLRDGRLVDRLDRAAAAAVAARLADLER
ncbi:ABC transporter ATP-binding protein [Actinophytocola oryzae]|uniref:Putative ABC transport system ATP-binding protein n=1 Tax=Actinophytocola oryzae TaxID=502181 RepID=A0A4R7W0P3_9PSEU|nr:ABC transporter ATP-binding protein [Actinophytocola oryzae]TDV56083.1 putative ABC transport system ATP-binding protein [Actinophytocola oryzae]